MGEYVQTQTPQSVFRQLSPYQLIKDEYETSTDYSQRRQSVLSGLSPIIVKGQVDPNFSSKNNVVYDADRQRFVIQQYFFDSFEDPPSANYAPRSLAPSQDKGELLTAENISVKLFEASRGSRYWLLDRYIKLGERQNVWPADDFNYSGGEFGGGSRRVNFVSVPADRARYVKDQIKIAYYFIPKEPVFFIREWVENRGRKKTENVIVGEIRCVLILDGEDRLLKTIRSLLYYEPATQPRPTAPEPSIILPPTLPPVSTTITPPEAVTAPQPAPQPKPAPIVQQPTPKPKPEPKPAATQEIASTEETLDKPEDGKYQTGGGF